MHCPLFSGKALFGKRVHYLPIPQTRFIFRPDPRSLSVTEGRSQLVKLFLVKFNMVRVRFREKGSGFE